MTQRYQEKGWWRFFSRSPKFAGFVLDRLPIAAGRCDYADLAEHWRRFPGSHISAESDYADKLI